MSYACRVLKDSVAPNRARITTLDVTFPRIVLAEFNTHRMFSRNSASSRAIPVEKQIARVLADPFVPVYWGKNQKGMQAEAELTAMDQREAELEWLTARDHAVAHARSMLAQGVHKQITNRLLEPFMWHTVIVTATEWDNFFALRCSPMAQPEIRVIAEMMRDAMAASVPVVTPGGGWHLPLCADVWDLVAEGYTEDEIARIACGRCARVSYLTHDGVRDPAADLELANRLQSAGHMSPFEHVARAASFKPTWSGNFRGWTQYRKTLAGEEVFRG